MGKRLVNEKANVLYFNLFAIYLKVCVILAALKSTNHLNTGSMKQAKTIQEVIAALDDIILQSEANTSRQAFFALLYKGMTEAVRDAILAGKFDDADRMEQLDVVFASRYLDAWHQYRQQQPITRSWKNAFDACTDDAPIVLQHLMLGINTHINLDLGIAAATIAPGDAILSLQSDFERINDIIAALTDGMQAKLERIWWPMRLIRRVMNGKDEAVIAFSITKARQAAWTHAMALSQLPEQAADTYIDQLDLAVAGISSKIARPGGWAAYVLRLVRWWEPKGIPTVIGILR